MEKDLPVVYVPKISCFIALLLTKIITVIYSYLYKTTQQPKNSYTWIRPVTEKNQIPSFREFYFTIKMAKI